jgi:stress-induced morphogen
MLPTTLLSKKIFPLLLQVPVSRSGVPLLASNTPIIFTSYKNRTMSVSGGGSFPVTESIRRKLTDAFHPQILEVINESYMHNVPKNSETHFKVVVVSDQFDKVKSPLQRHRLVNAALATELEGPVHALSIVAKSPEQWGNNQTVPSSPNCSGGDGSLPKRGS